MEWVEVQGDDVEVAVEAALHELGLGGRDEAEIEIIQEPERGFFGLGGQKAIVRVKRRPTAGRSRARRRDGGSPPPRSGQKERSGSGRERSKDAKPQRQKGGKGGSVKKTDQEQSKPESKRSKQEERTVDIEEQAEVIKEFLEGLLDAFGIEGGVESRVEEDVIYAEVKGMETEALVGPKGSIMQAILELCRTIVQRKTQAGARIRFDVAGYAERRREALRIYAARLADKVLEEGGEVMLEAMNAADRKVVHDTISEIDGVRTFSEGEEPNRSVVVAKE